MYARAGMWAAGAGCFTLAVISSILPSAPDAPLGTGHLWLALLPIDGVAALVALIALLKHAQEGNQAERLGFAQEGRVPPPPRPRHVLLTILWLYPTCAVMTGISKIVLRQCGVDAPSPVLVSMAAQNDSLAFWISLVTATIVLAPVAEEFLFRLVAPEMLRELGVAHPAVWAAALFAIVHQVPENIPGLFLLGLVLARARKRSGSLLEPICMHAAFNTCAVLVLVAAKAANKLQP